MPTPTRRLWPLFLLAFILLLVTSLGLQLFEDQEGPSLHSTRNAETESEEPARSPALMPKPSDETTTTVMDPKLSQDQVTATNSPVTRRDRPEIPERPLSLQVVDERGQPVEDAVVVIHSVMSKSIKPGVRSEDSKTEEGRTNLDGRYCSQLVGMHFTFHVEKDNQSHSGHRSWLVGQDSPIIFLKAPAQVHCLVLNELGAPQPNADVYFYGRSSLRSREQTAHQGDSFVTTNQEGRCSFALIAGESTTVMARFGDQASFAEQILRPPSGDDLHLTLQMKGRFLIRGHLLEADRETRLNTTVVVCSQAALSSRDMNPMRETRVQLDALAEFSADINAPGAYLVVAEGPGRRQSIPQIVTVSIENPKPQILLSLPETTSCALQILQANGSPLTKAYVQMRAVLKESEREFDTQALLSRGQVESKTDNQGFARVEPLNLGEFYDLEILSDDKPQRSFHRQGLVASVGQKEIQLTDRECQTFKISGALVSSNGEKPIADVECSLYLQDASGEQMLLASTQTTQQGRFAFPGLQSDHCYWISAKVRDFAPIEEMIDDLNSDRELSLEAHPLLPFAIFLLDSSGQPARFMEFEVVIKNPRARTMRSSLRTNENGQARARSLPCGHFECWLPHASQPFFSREVKNQDSRSWEIKLPASTLDRND